MGAVEEEVVDITVDITRDMNMDTIMAMTMDIIIDGNIITMIITGIMTIGIIMFMWEVPGTIPVLFIMTQAWLIPIIMMATPIITIIPATIGEPASM